MYSSSTYISTHKRPSFRRAKCTYCRPCTKLPSTTFTITITIRRRYPDRGQPRNGRTARCVGSWSATRRELHPYHRGKSKDTKTRTKLSNNFLQSMLLLLWDTFLKALEVPPNRHAGSSLGVVSRCDELSVCFYSKYPEISPKQSLRKGKKLARNGFLKVGARA